MTPNSFRQWDVIPTGYHEAQLTLVGTSSLLMNSGEADPESDLFRAYWTLGQKRSKSLEDEKRLRELEWQLAIYLDDELGPYVPGKNIHELLRSAATKYKRGEDVKRSLIVGQHRVPLEYKGPRDQQGLWDKGFRYTAMVSNSGFNRGRVRRCRPAFHDWSLRIDLAWDSEDLDDDMIGSIVERSQKFGLGDYRPQFGSFVAVLGEVGVRDGSVAQNGGVKGVDDVQLRAHEAAVERVRGKGREAA